MKRFLIVLAVSCVVSSVPAFAAPSAGLKKVCSSILSVSGAGTIYKQSAPLRSGGVGTPLIGYRKEPTLIYNLNNFSGGSYAIVDKKGNKLASCPYASAEGHRGRARCTVKTADVRRRAVANTGSPTIYFVIHSSRKRCVEVIDAGRCQGSVKGLCNQLIK